MANDDLEKQKEVQFYAAGATAWFNTRLEHHKAQHQLRFRVLTRNKLFQIPISALSLPRVAASS